MTEAAKQDRDGRGEDIDPRLRSYVALVDFLADVFGPAVEVVLHDLSNLDQSIVAIRNGHVSGRELGAPATDLVLKILRDEKASRRPFLTNYPSRTKQKRGIRSSTFFIRDQDDFVGMLCVNTDLSQFDEMFKQLDTLRAILGFGGEIGQEVNEEAEQLSLTTTDVTEEALRQVMEEVTVAPQYLPAWERNRVIADLDSRGVFLLKGAVAQVAEVFAVSEPTIYRSLQTSRRQAKKERHAHRKTHHDGGTATM